MLDTKFEKQKVSYDQWLSYVATELNFDVKDSLYIAPTIASLDKDPALRQVLANHFLPRGYKSLEMNPPEPLAAHIRSLASIGAIEKIKNYSRVPSVLLHSALLGSFPRQLVTPSPKEQQQGATTPTTNGKGKEAKKDNGTPNNLGSTKFDPAQHIHSLDFKLLAPQVISLFSSTLLHSLGHTAAINDKTAVHWSNAFLSELYAVLRAILPADEYKMSAQAMNRLHPKIELTEKAEGTDAVVPGDGNYIVVQRKNETYLIGVVTAGEAGRVTKAVCSNFVATANAIGANACIFNFSISGEQIKAVDINKSKPLNPSVF